MKRLTFELSYAMAIVIQVALVYAFFNGLPIIILGQPMGMLYGVIIVIAWKRLKYLGRSKTVVVLYTLAVLPIHCLSFIKIKMIFMVFILSVMLFLYIIRFTDEEE